MSNLLQRFNDWRRERNVVRGRGYTGQRLEYAKKQVVRYRTHPNAPPLRGKIVAVKNADDPFLSTVQVCDELTNNLWWVYVRDVEPR